MEAKGVFSVVGLGFDLIGAFFLSVPLVWDIDALVKFTEVQASVVRKGVLRTIREGIASRQVVLWAAASLFVLGLAAGSGLAYVVYAQFTRRGLATQGMLPTIIGIVAGWLISVAILAVIAGGLSIFLRWVRRGQHERRVGQVGLLLLCLGFLCQALVNFL